jgi:hypothetical protein
MKKIQRHKREALHESLCNTFVGFIIGYSFTVIIGPYILGAAVTHEASIVWTLAMTVLSVARGYAVRVYFSRKRYIVKLKKELLQTRKAIKGNKRNG